MSEYFRRVPPDDRFSNGHWEKDPWTLFETAEMPPLDLCTTSAIVAITDIAKGEVALTENNSDDPARKGKLELPGGHRDPRDPKDPDGPKESPLEAASREGIEEAGFFVARAGLFACRHIFNSNPSSDRVYPPEAYSVYFWATTDKPLGEPTDIPKPIVGTFPVRTLQKEVVAGRLDDAEFAIITRGVLAARRDLGLVA